MRRQFNSQYRQKSSKLKGLTQFLDNDWTVFRRTCRCRQFIRWLNWFNSQAIFHYRLNITLGQSHAEDANFIQNTLKSPAFRAISDQNRIRCLCSWPDCQGMFRYFLPVNVEDNNGSIPRDGVMMKLIEETL